MTAQPGWAIACIVTGAVLILCAVVTVPPLRRRRTQRAVAAEPVVLADDYPTAPVPVIPRVPSPKRAMLGREDLLWFKGAVDGEGSIVLGLTPEPAGQLGVLMDVDGEAAGVRLDRHEVQGLRDALTNHLVGTAKPVRS